VADPAARTKDVSLVWAAFDWDSISSRVRLDMPEGGCGLLLCNTVGRAQDAFRTLRPALEAEGWTVRLFHARFPAAWRQEREAWVLDTFGKGSPQARGGQKIFMVASQVVEQSLDLDLDWIASEMAPGDLLLQRMGRLWRHQGRARAVSEARFVILCGEDANGFPVFPDYAELIYDRYVLLRSWLAMRARGDRLTLPGGIDRLVQEVYAPEMPEGLSDAWRNALMSAQTEMRREQAEDAGKAQQCSLPGPEAGLEAILKLGSTLDRTRRTLWDDEDPRVHETVRAATRLGDASVGIVCTGTDEDGKPLAPMPVGEPRLGEVRQMLRFGLPLSRPKPLYQALVAQDPPRAWKDSALLRYQRELPFAAGRATLGGYDLRLSRAEGLVIEKGGGRAEE
jgi:CRISPR-associated endonuclease/helicase Cas3